MPRYALGIEYLGCHYSGWQRQKHCDSVQQQVENVLSEIADQSVEVTCAGRTDAGVHATAQVVHFDITQERPLKAWLMGANSMLPNDISVYMARQVPEDFHARFSARDRTYHYQILNSKTPSAILHQHLTWIPQPLDSENMHLAAQALLGEQNFASFRSSQCQSHSEHRLVSKVSVIRRGDRVVFEITANAFLHHMVRNVMGSLIEVGLNRQSADWIESLIQLKDRTQAGVTAPPQGLYLSRVRYDAKFQLPDSIRYPMGLSLD